MGHDYGTVCQCSVNHQPGVLENVIHHIWPIGDEGPDDPSNEVFVCPTCHYNVHELYRTMKREGRQVSYYEFSKFYEVPVSKYAYRLAALGFRRYVAKAMVD